MTLLESTLSMIPTSGHSLSRIAYHCGVTLRWLQLVRKGKIADPGVRKIQRIHDFLLAVPSAPRRAAVCRPATLEDRIRQEIRL